MKLKDKAAIITGASQGLGRAIAENFVNEGASVLLVARSEDQLKQVHADLTTKARPGQRIEWMRGDVANPAHCQGIVQKAREWFPNLCILVNNAGIYGPIGRIEEVDWQEWVETYQINLFGTIMMCRAMIPVLRAAKRGKIINLSGGGATAPLPRFTAYAGSKAAVVRLTETMAEELREDGIDVNSLAPGALNTRMLDQVLAAGPDKAGKSFHEKAIKQQNDGGAPLEKGAALAVFLASSESDGITGRLLSAVWDKWSDLPKHIERLKKNDVFTLRRIVPEDRGVAW